MCARFLFRKEIFHLRSDFIFIFTYAYVMHTIWCDYERIFVWREVFCGVFEISCEVLQSFSSAF